MEQTKENFIIFSDESGHWNSSDEKFYVRGWLKIKYSDFYYLSGYWKENKFDYPTEKNLKKSLEILSNKDINFQVFFTFSNITEFRRRKFVPRDYLTSIIVKALTTLEGRLKNGVKTKLQKRFESDINYIFFLYTYENWHIKNFFEKLCSFNEKYEFHFNKPQFIENDYKDIFVSCYQTHFNNNETNIRFVKNKDNSLGLALIDSLTSFFKKLLNILVRNDNPAEKYVEILKEAVKNSPEGNIGIKGINKIFFPVSSYKIQDLIQEENNLIYQLKNICN